MLKLIYLPGDGYTPEVIAPFIDYLEAPGVEPTVIPLREMDEDCSYDDLEADSYCAYIDTFVDTSSHYVIYGISKGGHWARVYAAKRPQLISKCILVEPTTLTPGLLVKFEEHRGNDFIEDYRRIDARLPYLDSTHKALDAIVSDDSAYIPRCPTVVIWTSRDNQGQPYDEPVLHLKSQFIRYLRSHGCPVTVKHLDADHCVDTHERYDRALLDLI